MAIGFAFADERTLDRVLALVSDPIDFLTESGIISQENISLAKITEIISDTEAKAIQHFRNSDGSTEEYPGGLLFDTDEDQTILTNVPNLIAYAGFKFTEDQVVQTAYIPFADGAKHVGFPPASGGARPLIRLNAESLSGNPGEFAGDIVLSRTDTGGVITAGITIVAPKVQQGTLPIAGGNPGRFYRADPVDNVGNISNALGGDVPAIVYEIEPPVWLGV